MGHAVGHHLHRWFQDCEKLLAVLILREGGQMKDPVKHAERFSIYNSHAMARGGSWNAKPNQSSSLRLQNKPKHGYQLGFRIVRNK
jgi:hypothetical protein